MREGVLFERSHNVETSKRKELTNLGLGNKPNATRLISPIEEENHLFEKRSLKHIHLSLSNVPSVDSGHRARDEGRQLRYGDTGIENEFNSEQRVLDLEYGP